MSIVVDSHVHVFKDPFEQWKESSLENSFSQWVSPDSIQSLRRNMKEWVRPISRSIHQVQTIIRHLPAFARDPLDQLGGVISLPGLLVESTPSDLCEAMAEANIDYAWLIAHPPLISNEFVLETCANNPKLIPVVNIPKAVSRPGQVLRKYAEKGARVLKIHPAADGEGPDSPRYRALIRTAADLGLPVILHTGCMKSRILFRDPFQGHAERFTKWYETYSQIRFVLAHMNLHDPNTALDLCEEFPNLWIDTSWQPAEMMGEAARRIGAERILFASGWPLVGNNMLVARRRIMDCIDSELLNAKQAELILGENAIKLLKK